MSHLLCSFFVLLVVSPSLLAQFGDPLNESFYRENLHLSDLGEFGFQPEKDPSLPDPQGAKAGIDLIFGGRGFRMFVPEDLFRVLIDPDRQRQWLVYGNSPSPKSRKLGGKYSDGVGIGLNYALVEEGDTRYATFTCFQCHAGMVAGRLVAGVGNAHIDQSALEHDLATYKRIRDHYKGIRLDITTGLVDLLGGLDARSKDHLMYFSLYSETILRPAIKRARFRGDDYGPYPVWQLMARMKDRPEETGFEVFDLEEAPTAALQARENLVRQMEFGPVDRRPWWVRKHDTKSYIYGDTLAAPEAGKDFAINFTVPHAGMNATYGKRSEEISTILKFALQTKAPTYPRKVNAKLADTGAGIYQQKCSRCHGEFVPNNRDTNHRWILKYRSKTYSGSHPFWVGKHLPDVLYSAADKVDTEWTEDTDLFYSKALQRWGGTDPESHQPLDGGLTGHAARSREFFAKQGVSAEKLPAVYNPSRDGYRAPPLVGIWASAPYLHNGSVPTLDDLFEVKERRPLIWERNYDTSDEGSYDFERVGLLVNPLTKMPKAPAEDFDHVRALNYRRIFDARLNGYKNVGARTCGPNLESADRKLAVIEFLKTLDDSTVLPEGTPAQWGRPLN